MWHLTWHMTCPMTWYMMSSNLWCSHHRKQFEWVLHEAYDNVLHRWHVTWHMICHIMWQITKHMASSKLQCCCRWQQFKWCLHERRIWKLATYVTYAVTHDMTHVTWRHVTWCDKMWHSSRQMTWHMTWRSSRILELYLPLQTRPFLFLSCI
jgi:hypothetical protein